MNWLLQQMPVVVVMGIVVYVLYKMLQKERDQHLLTQTAYMSYMKEVNEKQLASKEADLQSKLQMIGLLDQILKKIKQ